MYAWGRLCVVHSVAYKTIVTGDQLTLSQARWTSYFQFPPLTRSRQRQDIVATIPVLSVSVILPPKRLWCQLLPSLVGEEYRHDNFNTKIMHKVHRSYLFITGEYNRMYEHIIILMLMLSNQ